MKKIYFRYAGRYHDEDTVYLRSRNRMPVNGTIFHRNRYTTELRIPSDALRQGFMYSRYHGQYIPIAGILKWKDVKQWTTVIDHDIVGSIK